MASVRDTVYSMLVTCPNIFETRSDCFRQLFLTCGNGMEWEGGQLVDVCQPLSMQARFLDEESEAAKHDGDMMKNIVRRHTRLANARIRFSIENFDLLYQESISFTRHGWLTDSCPLFSAPAVLDDDWDRALNEASRALLMAIKDREHMNSLNNLPAMRDKAVAVRQRWAAQDRVMAEMIDKILKETE